MLCIVGGGKMGMALADGIVSKPDPGPLTIVEHNAERREELVAWAATSGKGRVTIATQPVAAEGAVIAVKPRDVELAVSDAVNAGAKRIVSIAAGVQLSRLHEFAGHGVPVVRAMPNIGAMVGRSATAMAGAPNTQPDDLKWAEQILSAVGAVVIVSEDQLDAVTGLSGSGPGYIFLIAEAMIDAGVHAGLPADIARQLTFATLAGAGEILARHEGQPAELRALVTTPAGTTAAGLKILEDNAVRAAFITAVKAAADRSHQLGIR